MMRSAFLLFVLVSTCVAQAADSVESPLFHIAPPPLGNDAHDGTAAAPFATLERARLAVRQHLAAHELRAHIVVQLQPGRYEFAAPVRFDAADSGKNGFSVIYRAAPGADVILSGGRSITGWNSDGEGNFRAGVGRDIDFRQLWIDGRRAIRARTPNVGLTFTLENEKAADGFDVPSSHFESLDVVPNEIEMSVLIAWMHKRLRIAGVAPSERPGHVRAIIAAPEWDGITRQPQGTRTYLDREYWLENARAFLDAPGEFHLDRASGLLRYRPRADEDVSRLEVVRPELENLVVLEGTFAAPVHHLRFEGLTFAYTGWTRPNRHGFVDVQANSLVPADLAAAVDPQYRHDQRKDRIAAAFEATTADHIVIRNCRFARLGGAGIMFSRGGDDNVIEGNSFYDLSAGGIEIGDDAARPDNLRQIPRRNRIANNFLAHIGEEYFGSVAILGYYTDRALIAHNEIAALPYTAISEGWGWGQPSAPPDSRQNILSHNRVFNYMRQLDDGGGLYTTDRQPGSEIAFNWLERMLPPDADTTAGGAIYLDQFSEGFHVHHNVVDGAVRWLNIWNPNIRGNRVDTNYADTASQRNDGTDNIVEPVHVAHERQWPEAAQAIMREAGLEPRFASAREFLGRDHPVIGPFDIDVQLVSGAWTTGASDSGHHAARRESRDPAAFARWMPLLSRAGRYSVAVWLPADAAAAHYVVHHRDGRAETTVTPASAGRWADLGTFLFPAGIVGDIEVRRASTDSSRPLIVDALRFQRIGDD